MDNFKKFDGVWGSLRGTRCYTAARVRGILHTMDDFDVVATERQLVHFLDAAAIVDKWTNGRAAARIEQAVRESGKKSLKAISDKLDELSGLRK